MYKYETHLHTSPVSKCSRATVKETLDFYKELQYDGVCITNHFLDGNVNISADVPYEEQIEFYFSDYEAGVAYGKEIGIKVFCGVELSYKGTDFLIYGLDKVWFLAHPEIMEMKKSEELAFMMEEGALVIQAHPYREVAYIDHIRLFPRCVHGVEIINASGGEFSNGMAKLYQEYFELIPFAGSDNHKAGNTHNLAGMEGEKPVNSVEEFILAVKNRELKPFAAEVTF